MKLNLRKLAESNIKLRLETDEDRDEFWELYVEQDGNMDGDRSREMLNRHYCLEIWIYSKYDKVTFNVFTNDKYYPTWTEIKERYMNDKEIEKLAKNIYKALTNTITDNKYKINQAITLLQSHGYTLTPPYIEPTDEEICDRIKAMNEEIGYVADCSKSRYIIAQYNTGLYEATAVITVKSLGTTYTTQSIAKQIVAELNEKRFVRV